MDERVPVIVGVGEVLGDRDRTLEGAREPLSLIEEAVRRAAADTGAAEAGAGVLAALDEILAVRTTSWTYDDAPSLVAERVGASPSRRETTNVGGHWPTRLLEQAAARIASGGSSAVLLFGGEAQASLGVLTKAGRDPAADAGWLAAPGGPPSFDPADLGSPAMQAGGVILPTRVYPMFANARQAHLGLDPEEAAARSAALYARLTEVASRNPIAWNPRVRTAADIATVSPSNRMVAEPYPLAVNAMPHVDQAAAVVVTSVATARELGIPEDRWVYVRGGAGADDTVDVLSRRTYATSDALAATLDLAARRTGVPADALDLVDVYSCFPIVPELVADLLHLGDDATPSTTGGHAAFGGPLSSYSLHAIASVTRRLRDDLEVAMVHANGGYMTYQHVTVLAATPHPDGYLGDPDPVTIAPDEALVVRPAADVLAAADGDDVALTIETFTVEHGRDGAPAQAFVIGRTPAGERTAAATAPGDRAAAQALSLAALPPGATTHVGRTVTLTAMDAGPAITPVF